MDKFGRLEFVEPIQLFKKQKLLTNIILSKLVLGIFGCVHRYPSNRNFVVFIRFSIKNSKKHKKPNIL